MLRTLPSFTDVKAVSLGTKGETLEPRLPRAASNYGAGAKIPRPLQTHRMPTESYSLNTTTAKVLCRIFQPAPLKPPTPSGQHCMSAPLQQLKHRHQPLQRRRRRRRLLLLRLPQKRARFLRPQRQREPMTILSLEVAPEEL